jgi:transposase
MDVVVGIDSHKSSLGVTAIDELGRPRASQEFPNSPKGHRSALNWITSAGDVEVVGVEGSGHYGAGITRMLVARGLEVKEVPPFLTARERKRTPARGKSDIGDATAIARVAQRGESLSEPTRAGAYEDLALMVNHRDQLLRARTRVANRTHSLLARIAPGYETRVARLNSARRLSAARMLVRGDNSIAATLVRDNLCELKSIDERVKRLTARINQTVVATETSLTSLKGVGALTAAKILGEINDPVRLRSAAAFAMLNGTAPIPASSGTTQRHRLNRGGNRQLNSAIHMIAVSLCRCDDRTRAYVARRVAEGKTRREAMRALKRHLSDVIYACLRRDDKPALEAA